MNTRAIHMNNLNLTEEQFKAWLQTVDKNKDGRISRQELQDALQVLGLRYKWWRARRAINKADLNNNGCIDGESEIKALLDHARKHWGVMAMSK